MTTPSTKQREAGTSTPIRRRARRRLSATHVLIAVVVILAFILNLLVLRDRDATTLVAVADRPLTTGATLTESTIRFVSVDAGFPPLGHLVTADNLSAFDGWILDRAITEGAVIDTSALVEPGDGSGLRSMSIPIERSHAAGGSLVAGDRVDVISVDDGVPSYVATDLEVTGVAEQATGSIGSVSSYHVVLSVTADEALALAGALDAGSLEIVRSTGAEVLAADVEEVNDS